MLDQKTIVKPYSSGCRVVSHTVMGVLEKSSERTKTDGVSGKEWMETAEESGALESLSWTIIGKHKYILKVYIFDFLSKKIDYTIFNNMNIYI